ncbi:MAG: SDR family oxidoreductase [bacterium]
MTKNRATALVTGASSGIGWEMAKRLAQEGYPVIAAARRLDRLEALAREAGGITPKTVDLAHPEGVEAFCRFLRELPEPVGILVNNAGYSIRGVLENQSVEAMQRLFQVNVFALIRITQSCLPGMRSKRRGTIVNVSSLVGKVSNPLNGVYAASKHAVEAVSDALRLELRPFGIRVVTVRPGPVATEFHAIAQQWDQPQDQMIADYVPILEAAGKATKAMLENLRMAKPEDVARVIVEAILSDAPAAAYTAGPLVEDMLAERKSLSDDEFDRMMAKRMGLWDLRLT